MSEPKTKPTEVSAESHIAAIANEEQRNDAQTLVALMRRVTEQEPELRFPLSPGLALHGCWAVGAAEVVFALQPSSVVVNAVVWFVQPPGVHRAKEDIPGLGQGHAGGKELIDRPRSRTNRHSRTR